MAHAHDAIYAADAAAMTDKELADQILSVVNYPGASSAGWRRAVAAEAARRLRDIAFPDLDEGDPL